MRTLTESDFVEVRGLLVPRSLDGDGHLLVIAHSQLDGTSPDDGAATEEFHDFFRAMLAAAEEFPEFEACLLNYDEAPSAIRRLGVARVGSSDFAEAMIYSASERIRHIIYDQETADSIRLWLRGTSLALGLRTTRDQDDLVARLAYELAEPDRFSFSDARWDEPNFRSKVYRAARNALDQLTNAWASQSPR